MSGSDWQTWFEEVWKVREEIVYPQLFGSEGRGIFTLSPEIFLETFEQESFDPRWLFYGVFEFPPSRSRESWLYVTSGMSNAWEDDLPDPAGPSGMGSEFVFETVEQGEWAIDRLHHLMAFQILIVHDRYQRKEPISCYDRIPLLTSLTPEPSELRWLILAPPESYPARFQLASGGVDLVAVFGASDAEAAFAREHGGEKLVEVLQQHGAFPVTDPRRGSVIRGS